MKRYWVFAWDSYYPEGGMNDLQGRFETYEEAEELEEELKRWDQVRIVDIMGYC